MTTALAISPDKKLAQCEAVIERGLEGFVAAGLAMAQIRDEGLYKRPGCKNFEEYVESRWGFTVRRARQLMSAAAVGKLLGDGNHGSSGNSASERALRPLAGVPPALLQAVWARALELAGDGKMPTFRHTSAAAKEILAKKGKHAVHFSSESDEHNTPREIVEAILRVFGGRIGLDPCSNRGDPNVPADKHFTVDGNGLEQPWIAPSVYMNPPYGREIGAWTGKLRAELEAGNTPEAISLLPARTDAQWWIEYEPPVACFVEGRLHFSESKNGAPFPSAVVYHGDRPEDFAREFHRYGHIWARIPTKAEAA